METVKVALCIPCHGDVKAGFAESLNRLIIRTLTAPAAGPKGPVRFELEPFYERSSVLIHGRETLVRRALAWGAEWLLLLDADHVFPPDALVRLLAHGRPVVGCNYRMKDNSGPVAPIAEGLGEVDYLGLGLFLVHRHPFHAMGEAAKAAGRKTILPLFQFERTEDGGIVAEDVYFCRKLKAAGFPVLCDHELSREVDHIAEGVLRLEP